MDDLNLPSFPLRVKQDLGKTLIFDVVRKKFVVLNPEEWVRQHFVHYLIKKLHYPRSLIKVEGGTTVNTMSKRSDIQVYDRAGRCIMLVECKSAQVPIDNTVFEQLAIYNQVYKARYLTITNGLKHYCCEMDYTLGSYRFLSDIPPFTETED